jgi:prepilin-type N-terminal cleavage/methylation domain-containing protein
MTEATNWRREASPVRFLTLLFQSLRNERNLDMKHDGIRGGVRRNTMKSAGFTLIELVMVIVILGILAATALPRFVDLSSGARAAVMKDLEGKMRSANAMAGPVGSEPVWLRPKRPRQRQVVSHG